MSIGRPDLLLLPLLADPPLSKRLGLLAMMLVFGAWMIYVGRGNVRLRMAEETGKRRLFLKLAGKSPEITGRSAVWMGWLRIVVGVAAILFGFAFLFFGEFLKR